MLAKPRVIFFDAVGTLIHLPKGPACHYVEVAARHGLTLREPSVAAAFQSAWRQMPVPPVTGLPRPDDDRGWWRELVFRVLEASGGSSRSAFDRDAYFTDLYEEFARPGIWALYPDAAEVLPYLAAKHALGIISNFDGRLRRVLQLLGAADYFTTVTISSEVGAEKPHPHIFKEAVRKIGAAPDEALHVGDEAIADWEGAAACGLQVFRLERPAITLHDLTRALAVHG